MTAGKLCDLWVGILCLAACLSGAAVVSAASKTVKQDAWQKCELFLAPSPVSGWGVFAARDFRQGEIVEVAPLFVPFPYKMPLIKQSALDDYIYGYYRYDGKELYGLAAVVWGMTMYYNHHPTAPNVAWTTFGREPMSERELDRVSNAVGFVARRDIEEGEELFSTYGSEDGGKQWFRERRMELLEVPPVERLPNVKESAGLYCSKMAAGMGQSRWANRLARILPEQVPFRSFPVSRLPPRDAPYAVAKVAIKPGDCIEVAPALILKREWVQGTAMAPLVFTWEELSEYHDVLRGLREHGHVRLQHQSKDTNWTRIDVLDSLEECVLLPAAGTMGTMQRVFVDDTDDFYTNAKLIIHGHDDNPHPTGVVLQAMATKSIAVGETIRLDLASRASIQERTSLAMELRQTGQPSRDDLSLRQGGSSSSSRTQYSGQEL